MSGATKNPAPTDKDFGRRLYVSEKVYPEQMRTVTDKAKQDEKPFHLSEFKKPYATDSYGEMEHNYSWPWGFGFIDLGFDLPVVKNEDEEEEATYGSRLKWVTKPPDIVDVDHWYLIEVAKASRTKRTIKNGRVVKTDMKYLLPRFSIHRKTADAKDMEVEQRFQVRTSRFAVLWEGPIGRSVNFVYEWVKTGTERFLYLIQNIWNGAEGTTVNDESVMVAKLITGGNAEGTYEVQVTDGKTTLKHKVRVSEDALTCVFPTTIGQNDSAFLQVIGGTAPYTWSASLVGTSFGLSIDTGETSEINTLTSDADARGSIEVTVTDADGKSCSGTIKCVVGAETYYELTPDKYPTGCACVDYHLLYTIPYIPPWQNGYAWYATGAETTAAAYAIANAEPGGWKITSWDTCGQQWAAGNPHYAARTLLTYEGCGSGYDFGKTRWEAW